MTPPTVHGHPRGLFTLASTELWERFSYYGMSALLVLYMVQELLLPGHIENVWGMAAFQSAIESIFGPLSAQALASQIYGLYGGLVYFTPMLGGWLADHFFGARRMVLIGIVLMAAGHLAMTFEETFLIALVLLIAGSGALKGNIAAQVGKLYGHDQEALRSRGFTIFSVFINVGAFGGPLVTGALAQGYGWHAGFAFAGALMLLAIIAYVAGRAHLPDDRPANDAAQPVAPLSSADWRSVLLMLPILFAATLTHIGYFQSLNVGFVWISDHVDLATPLGVVPVPWFASVDPLAGIIVMPLLLALWRVQAQRGREPDDFGKVIIGMLIMAAGIAMFAIGALNAGGGKTSLVWPILAYIGTGVAFLWYWPVTLSFVSRNAPQAINSLVVSASYLTLFVAGLATGVIGSFYEALTPAAFFLFNAAIPATGAALLFAAAPMLRRALDARHETPIIETEQPA